jgi:hypothetical protein
MANTRPLNGLEQAEARRVFGASLTLSRVEIADDTGIGDRPWTGCGLWMYTIHLGKNAYENGTSQTPGLKATLIHELTHCWQGQNSTFGFGYMIGSVCSQAKSLVVTAASSPKGPNTAAAYEYKLGKDWTDYNCEQQASIVEDWYAGGCSDTDPGFSYIRDYVRKGKT